MYNIIYMNKRSERYRKVFRKIENKKVYPPTEALNFCKENNQEKSSNIEAAFSFHWNEKNPPLRTTLFLPHPVKKPRKIAIVGKKEVIAWKKEIDESMIEFIEIEELAERIKQERSKWNFQKLFAQIIYQDKLKPLARILGPARMFPNSKDGTLAADEDLATKVEEFQKGKTEIRSDKNGNVHTLLGKTSFSLEQLEKNYQTLYDAVASLKPSNWKGKYLRNITISTTMGPGIKILN